MLRSTLIAIPVLALLMATPADAARVVIHATPDHTATRTVKGCRGDVQFDGVRVDGQAIHFGEQVTTSTIRMYGRGVTFEAKQTGLRTRIRIAAVRRARVVFTYHCAG